jgi:redox-sensitive bicupin YhaK (pirin superfamily)
MPNLVINARDAALNRIMMVRRLLPFRLKRMIGPFIFMDHGGPIYDIPSDSSMDILPHPHIGLSTITYLFAGRITHRDSLGVTQGIIPGEVNWMTAGKGIAHSERFENTGELKEGVELIQTWVALPEKDEESEPAFNNYSQDQLLVFTEKNIWLRLIAGNAYGLMSPVKTNSPLFYIHARVKEGAYLEMPSEYPECGLYIANGSIESDGFIYSKGQLLVFSKPVNVSVEAKEPSTLMILGGEPLGERYIWWNFVSSSMERIEQAKEDWRHGRIKLPPSDNKEFVPLPEDKKGRTVPKPELLS